MNKSLTLSFKKEPFFFKYNKIYLLKSYYVEYFSKEEFENKLEEIKSKYENERGETATATATLVQNELNDIEKNKNEIYR